MPSRWTGAPLRRSRARSEARAGILVGVLGLLLLLAAIQGLTEFLPVSSSGHLVLGRSLLPGGDALPQDATVEVLLHAGTLIAVLAFYRREVRALLAGLCGFGGDVAGQRRLAAWLVIGSLPAALVGLGFEARIDEMFAHPSFAASALLVTGGLLLWSRRFPAEGRGLDALDAKLALAIGLAQAIAILPGISRSGATIVAGMALGLSLPAAATFSFLLSIPAVGGACALKLPEVDFAVTGGVATAAAAVVASALVGLASLGLLVRLGRARRLWWFAPYCGAVGIAGLFALAAGA